MIKRNKYMVDKSSLLKACFDGSEGGIKDTFDYALKKGIDIVCINPKTMIVTNIVNEKGYYQLTLF